MGTGEADPPDIRGVFGDAVVEHLNSPAPLYELLHSARRGEPDPDAESHRPETAEELVEALESIVEKHGDVPVEDAETGTGVHVSYSRGRVRL